MLHNDEQLRRKDDAAATGNIFARKERFLLTRHALRGRRICTCILGLESSKALQWIPPCQTAWKRGLPIRRLQSISQQGRHPSLYVSPRASPHAHPSCAHSLCAQTQATGQQQAMDHRDLSSLSRGGRGGSADEAPPAKIDKSRNRYPYAIAWTPLPMITWLIPFIGHMGLCDSRGRVHDFAGPYVLRRGWPVGVR